MTRDEILVHCMRLWCALHEFTCCARNATLHLYSESQNLQELVELTSSPGNIASKDLEYRGLIVSKSCSATLHFLAILKKVSSGCTV